VNGLRLILMAAPDLLLPVFAGADHPIDDADAGGFPWSLVVSLGIIAAVAAIWVYSALTDRRRPPGPRRR
jgi:hypothetical protein